MEEAIWGRRLTGGDVGQVDIKVDGEDDVEVGGKVAVACNIVGVMPKVGAPDKGGRERARERKKVRREGEKRRHGRKKGVEGGRDALE